MNLKKFFAAILVLALVFSLTSCTTSVPLQSSSKTSDTSAQKDKPVEDVTIRFAWWGSDSRHQATLEAIKLYESRNPNVTIEGEYSAFDSYYQKLLTQLTGATEPDIVTVDYKWTSDLMNQGEYFVNMYDLQNNIDMSSIDLQFAKVYGGDDKYLIGLPVGVNGMGYLYNTDFLNEMGVTPADDWTWETVIENGKKVQAKDPQKYLMFNHSEHWVYLVKTMLKQLTGNCLIQDDYSLGYSKEDLTKVFAYIKEMVDTKTVPPFADGVLYENVYADQNPNWLNKQFGIFPTSSSLYPGIQKASTFSVDVFRYPVMLNAKDPGILVTPSMFLTISKNSKHKEVAADFIDFMLNDPEAITILKDTRGIPVNTKAKDQLVKENIIIPEVSKMVSQALTGSGKAENAPSLNTEVIALIKDSVQQIGFGKSTPEKTAQEFTKQLETIIKGIK